MGTPLGSRASAPRVPPPPPQHGRLVDRHASPTPCRCVLPGNETLTMPLFSYRLITVIPALIASRGLPDSLQKIDFDRLTDSQIEAIFGTITFIHELRKQINSPNCWHWNIFSNNDFLDPVIFLTKSYWGFLVVQWLVSWTFWLEGSRVRFSGCYHYPKKHWNRKFGTNHSEMGLRIYRKCFKIHPTKTCLK